MIVLTKADVARLLPMAEAIEVIDAAMRVVSTRGAELPLRSIVDVGGGNRMGVMPGAMSDPACFGIKLISLFPGNPARGLSSHRGAYVLFESETGAATAMMDASLLTAIRTAAASAVATRALAPEGAERLTILGYGEQAEHHLDAMCAVRPITHVTVAGRDADKARAFCDHAAYKHPGLTFTATTDIPAAVADAQIICTVTAAPAPILMGDWVPSGCHVNVVGSSIPSMREVDDAFVTRAAIWVDYLPSTVAQAGEIVEMIGAGTITQDHLRGEIGALLDGNAPGPRDADTFTAYRSLGVAAQDLAAAQHVLRGAQKAGIGQSVTL